MAETRKIYTSKQYYAQFEGDSANTPSDFKGLGYYSRTSLEDVINNFIIAYIGEDKALSKVPRYEVDFWAQRAVQEFSYDILHSEKSFEMELGDALVMPLPQDYVGYIRVSYLGTDGTKINLLPNYKSGNPTAPLQDDDFDFLYDSNGDLQKAAKSELIKKFQEEDSNSVSSARKEYYRDIDDTLFSQFNKRYGSNPEDMTSSAYFVIDEPNGKIFFNNSLATDGSATVILDYISDGLVDNGDLSKVFIPKLAEDAIYAYVLYNLSKVRPTAAGLVPLYKKEASSKMRNTKIRLTDYSPKHLGQVLRGKAKWIKH